MLFHISGKIREALDKLNNKDEKIVNQSLIELESALIDADVSMPAASNFIKLVKQNKNESKSWLECLHSTLIDFLTCNKDNELNLKTKRPAVILMAGIQGAGKTTTTAKLACQLKSKSKVLVCSTDIYRPAAMEQLQILLEKENVEVVIQTGTEQPVAIAQKALEKAKNHNYDILIIDTAGRQHEQHQLMQELNDIKQATNPIETLMVLDGMTGNFAVDSARAFMKEISLTGFILTKMDGDQKGGAAISIVNETNLPIKFIGRGEQIDKLEIFDAQRFAKIILDMGDESGFIEKLQAIDTKKQQKLEHDIKKGSWDFNSYLEQIEQIQNLGGARELLSKMPGTNKIMANQNLLDQGDKNIQKTRAMIQSMTAKERSNPLLLENNKSRRKRIINGAASDIRSFNMMLKQFKQMKKMMGSLKGKGMAKLMAQLQKGI